MAPCALQVPCKAVEPELADCLEEVPDLLIAARFLHFLEYEGRACSVAEPVYEFRWEPTSMPEVPWQPMLVPILTVRPHCLLQKAAYLDVHHTRQTEAVSKTDVMTRVRHLISPRWLWKMCFTD